MHTHAFSLALGLAAVSCCPLLPPAPNSLRLCLTRQRDSLACPQLATVLGAIAHCQKFAMTCLSTFSASLASSVGAWATSAQLQAWLCLLTCELMSIVQLSSPL